MEDFPGFTDDPKVQHTLNICKKRGQSLYQKRDPSKFYNISSLRGVICTEKNSLIKGTHSEYPGVTVLYKGGPLDDPDQDYKDDQDDQDDQEWDQSQDDQDSQDDQVGGGKMGREMLIPLYQAIQQGSRPPFKWTVLNGTAYLISRPRS